MILQDMNGTFQVEDSKTLEEKLAKRYGSGVNAFLLSQNSNGAKLAILVNDELANVHYFPPGRHPGYNAIGNVSDLDAKGYSEFFLNSPDEPQLISNAHVVRFSAAVKAAREFLESDELPESMDWMEL